MNEPHLRLREWERQSPDEAHEFLRRAHLETRSDRELAERLSNQRVLALTDLHDGLEVRAFAHVGRVSLAGLTITIEPKLGRDELLRLFRYAYGFRNLRLFKSTTFETSGDLLQDVLVAQLHAEARELLERGLLRRYVGTSELLASPRGRIDMNRVAGSAGTVMTALPCSHHPRSTDHVLNRMLVGGLRLGARVAQDAQLKATASRLAHVVATVVDEAPLSHSILDSARRSLNRLSATYEPALRLTELLYYCSSLSMDDDRSIALPGFLFDMNLFFQALLSRFLRENLPGCVVRDEQALSDMMSYVAGHNPRRRKSPRPRPDFTVTGPDRTVRLLDAKYRDLWENSLSRDMLYQLSVYALSQPRGATAAILYPTMDAGAREARIEIREPVTREVRGYVALRPVILGELAASLERPSAARGRLAEELAFGARGSTRPDSMLLPASSPTR